jgi:hypothetical protein
MNKRIILFNVIYYSITLWFILLGRQDASSSLGYGFFIIIFWIAAGVALLFLLIRRKLEANSIFDKIGIIIATPIPSIIIVAIIVSTRENYGSESHFQVNGENYKEVVVQYESGATKRLEFYKSKAHTTTDEWVKDSTWIYFSEKGDTLMRVKFKNNVEVAD